MNETENIEVLDLFLSMIRTKSYSGHEQDMAQLMLKYMQDHGFDEAFIDQYGNVLGCLHGNRPGKTILFDGHIDTVPAENTSDWQSDPFEPVIRNGNVYGRGAADMKGADAAFLYAVAKFGEKHGRNFSGDLWVAGVVHEECFEGVSARIISERVKPDLVVIGEASEMNIKCSQRGRAEIVLETYGVPCHSSNPQKGVNAVYNMMKAFEAIRKLPQTHVDGMAGEGIMELTDIISEPYPGASVVPHTCRATFDRRLLVGETKENVLDPITKLLESLHEEDPSFKASAYYSAGKELCYTGETIAADRFFPAWKEDKDDPFVQSIYNEIKRMGYAPKLTGYSFCTNGSHYGGEAGIFCIGIGPGREDSAHTIDECIPIKDLYAIADYYTAVCNAITLI